MIHESVSIWLHLSSGSAQLNRLAIFVIFIFIVVCCAVLNLCLLRTMPVLMILCVLFSSECLVKLFSLMDQNSPERVAFVSRALKWSTGGSGKLGHPRLHQLLALTLWKGIGRCRTVYASCNSWSWTIVINIVIVLLDIAILVGLVLCCVSQRCFCISISGIGHTSPFVYSDFTEDLVSVCFRTKLQWVSLSLSSFIWWGGLCTDACGVFSITRLPQWGWHVCGAGRPTVSVIILCFYKLTAICDELLVCMCFSCPYSHVFLSYCA